MQHVRHNSSAPSTPIPFSARAAAINSASLAILSASSVSLRAIPVAVSLALLPSRSSSFASSDSDTVVLDPSLEEETAAGARFGFGWAVGSGISTVGGKSATSGQDNERSGGMDVDMARQDDAELEMELVWVDSEGSFSRAEVGLAPHYCTVLRIMSYRSTAEFHVDRRLLVLVPIPVSTLFVLDIASRVGILADGSTTTPSICPNSLFDRSCTSCVSKWGNSSRRA